MEYRVQLQTVVSEISAIENALWRADPAALVDQDPADGVLRVTAWLNQADLAALLAEAGFPARSVALQPSVCCGDCSG
jgi:hypothetical protein